jgi:prolyl-tRNA synthetase
MARMDAEFTVTCPYCGEDVDITIEADVRGVMVQDCEVCCNPWQLRVTREGDERYVSVERADGE